MDEWALWLLGWNISRSSGSQHCVFLFSFLQRASYTTSLDICKRLSACYNSAVSQLEPGQLNAARKVSRPRVWTNSTGRGQRKCCVTQTLEKEWDSEAGGGMTETLGTRACFISPIMTDGSFVRRQLRRLSEKLSKHNAIEEITAWNNKELWITVISLVRWTLLMDRSIRRCTTRVKGSTLRTANVIVWAQIWWKGHFLRPSCDVTELFVLFCFFFENFINFKLKAYAIDFQ